MTNFRLFHTEKFADENFKFDENGRKFSKWLENTVGKGEIACYKLKALADDKLNIAKMITFLLGRIENIVRKGENAGHQHFLLFPQCFRKVSSS